MNFAYNSPNSKLSKAREFERVVLGINRQGETFFKNKNSNYRDRNFDLEKEGEAKNLDDGGDESCTSRFWWWDPPKESVPKEFLLHSSMHGLHYLAMKKLNTVERVFWLIMFLTGLITAALLINNVWEKYKTSPVIMTFSPKEVETNFLPFPAVTICDVNKIYKSNAERIISRVKEHCGINRDEDLDLNNFGKKCNASRRAYQYLTSLCNTRKSFASDFGYSANQFDLSLLGNNSNETLESNDFGDNKIMQFLMKETAPCEEMIRLCIWSGEPSRNCSTIFRPILTENGKCCTFNSLPPELLYKFMYGQLYKERPNTYPNDSLIRYWSPEEINEWKKWDYNKDGFIINDPKIKYPVRQILPGITFGLSLLVDGNTDEYFCRSSDAEGLKVLIHNPLEKPQMSLYSMTIPLGKLVKMIVSPDLTEADPAIAEHGFAKRQCYFGRDKTLRYYNAYTTLNCIDECISNETLSNCSCVNYYMPRDIRDARICSSQPDSEDMICADRVQKALVPVIREKCKQCDTLCEDISYSFSMTAGDLRDSSGIWNDFNEKITNSTHAPPWANSTVSVVHIFIDSITTTPKLRATLYSPIDLIANVGGLLGLCLGFSVLSAVEVLYFFTCRFCFQDLRREKIGKKVAKKFINAVQSSVATSRIFNNRIITLDKTTVPVYPGYPTGISNTKPMQNHVHFE